ncbi:tyrosine-type recombinase/integrase [Sphingomonas aracearum]|uniref:Site-specific integrase n=1 Tax=Sphingomonas aracearum TaxID=2283317 RepID=A0A369VXA9_9SPHN|nr:site-specific integrase [Sphingomonas aracearum]RDE05712.1 site-specific integrase [Sphingomonas aracearum]
MGKLTQASIRAALAKPGRYRDGDGLLLFVSKPGLASWVCRYQKDGKRRDFGLGSLKTISLSEAREKARAAKKALTEDRDPHTLWKQPPAMTRLFRDVAGEFVAAKLSPGGQKLALSRLQAHAFPALGKLQVQSIDADAIAKALAPIWQSKPETAKRVRQLVIRVIRFARPDGPLLETTLAKGVSDRLPAQPRRGRFAAMDYRDVPGLMTRLESKGGFGALALRATILTAARSGEVRGATWDELDLERGVWTVPAERMKMRRAHRVPLSPEALAVFQQAASLRRAGTNLVFPSAKDGMLSDMTLSKALRDLGVTDATVHGFRSTFRDWAAEQTSLPGEVAEAALAHAVPNAVEAAYRRTTFFDLRRDLMDAWGRFASGAGSATVVPLASASA